LFWMWRQWPRRQDAGHSQYLPATRIQSHDRELQCQYCRNLKHIK
jgi:hypothetical protein